MNFFVDLPAFFDGRLPAFFDGRSSRVVVCFVSVRISILLPVLPLSSLHSKVNAIYTLNEIERCVWHMGRAFQSINPSMTF